MARHRGAALVTRAIVAESEVVGSADAAGAGHLAVLGQRVGLPGGWRRRVLARATASP